MVRERMLITGGAGFLGSHLADALVAKADVVLVDNFAAGKRANVADAVKAGATLVKRNLLQGDLRALFRRVGTVYHFAANPDVRLGKEGPKVHIEQNVLMTYRVLEACRANRVPRVVFASTSTVYGEAKTVPTPEDYGPCEPISLYGASKLACESLLSAYAHTYGLQAVVFRMANVVGGRSGHGVVHDLVAKLARDPKRLEIIGSDPGTSKSYIHVEDALAGYRAGLAAARGPFTVYNLGSEDAISVRTIADAICREVGLQGVEYVWTGGAGSGRGWVGDVRTMALAVERLRATGWRPGMTSEQAVARAAREAWSRIS
ncbi:MAG TPA: NAD-dependent epimerase/dehydratase family protein [Thermoplasmata archaeon]|nr:NAD-dependent epimerase/dehydratase family protein [Thermoplasmata archaeon]